MANTLPKLKNQTENNIPDVSDTNAIVAKKLNYLFEKDLFATPSENNNKFVKSIKSPLGFDSSKKLSPRSLSPKESRDKFYQLQVKITLKKA